ncbi:MAG: hypothetical protein J6X57_07330 [Bacteroidales bacterium]|nr:hypothetical protein [Bacteroidales bacterium]
MVSPDFIIAHENDDLAALVLQRDRWPDVDVALAAECIAARRKLRLKVPEWYGDPSLICPIALSAEQCSSTATASYKAAGVLGAEPPQEPSQKAIRRIADLTGGLGVDCWQFSKVAEAVLYNEMNPVLFEAAKANLKRLGCDNVEFSNTCISPSTLPDLLDSFKPDLVFIDPARRSGGRKVFLPEDCSPDVLALQDIILERGCLLMLKLSPMADISMLLRKFHCVKELHIVEADGECKELLLLMEPGFAGETTLVAGTLRFTISEEKAAAPVFISAMPEPGQLMFEPGPALAKSGAFKLISEKYGLRKLGPDTHLYISDSVIPDLGDLGKWFEIQEVTLFGKAALRDFATRWPGADVTARALPLSSDQLRLKLDSINKSGKIATALTTHIFGAGSSIGRILIATTIHKLY